MLDLGRTPDGACRYAPASAIAAARARLAIGNRLGVPAGQTPIRLAVAVPYPVQQHIDVVDGVHYVRVSRSTIAAARARVAIADRLSVSDSEATAKIAQVKY